MLMPTKHAVPELKIQQFEGPLDLLFHLIEKNDIDIYDIPIAEITDQYMAFLDQMSTLDMDVASDFLVMAATLIHIKSRMLLPDKRTLQAEEGEDPREELVIRLLHYRRCKILASDLRDRFSDYSKCTYRLPATPLSLDIQVKPPVQEFDNTLIEKACEDVCERNKNRFADISMKITHILKRDKISIRDKIRFVWGQLTSRGKLFFHELFPAKNVSKMDKIVGFLAVLELLRSNKIMANQEHPFDIIELERKSDETDGEILMMHDSNNKELASYD